MGDIGKTVTDFATSGGGLGMVLGKTMDSVSGGSGIASPVTQEQINTAYGNTQQGLAQQQAFLQALQAQGGIQNQTAMYNQLGNVAAGTGPNPAQAQLAQATQANIANQAALAAGQRGASQNVGMIARQAGQQGGNLQQQAVGQGASLQAQQSLAAMGQQANIAGQQVANQADATKGYTQGALQQQQNVLAPQTAYNQMMSTENSESNKAKAGVLGGLIGGAGAAMGAAHGGMMGDPTAGPQSMMARQLKMASGGVVPAMVSPGEAYIPPSKVDDVAAGAKPQSAGRMIPGKAKVKGDSLKNDTVPAKLETGGVVIPRTVMNKKDDGKAASKFVQAVLAKSTLRGKK